ncbi:protein of unknown function [Trichlorobacter ammonificans]|uniref:Uncharacterized protein n=1 Tax=Trichlorobacter ammonificans TaxID=2916410 RepID=A0ABM9D886_9BACT|nr:protein of unknown function [Trichlorobacter ammonificans]
MGRALLSPSGCRLLLADVSIHARPLGRALRQRRLQSLRPARSFNPRPPFGTGASELDVQHNLTEQVSIHARPLGRALHQRDECNQQSTEVSIHARPLGRALPTKARLTDWKNMFQSTPALWDGRFQKSRPHPFKPVMFQSTPALWDGRFAVAGCWTPSRWRFQSTPALWDGRFVDADCYGDVHS